MSSRSAVNVNTRKWLTGGLWIRIFIIVAAGYIFMQKDINFQVNLQSPFMEQNMDEQPTEADGKTQSGQELSENQSRSSSRLEGLTASLFGISKKVGQKKQTTPPPDNPIPVIRLKDINNSQIESFINRFSNVAISEKRKFGIPASIIMANGLLQSAAGQTKHAKEANNYFNLPCDSTWDGMMKDFNGQCFRKYENAWAGFRGHSRYINDNFGALKKYGTKDYKSWAKGLEQSGFNQQKKLSTQLIQIIEKYNLDQLDKK